MNTAKESLAKIFEELAVPGPLTGRQRPAKGGWSIGHVRSQAQTLGCLVSEPGNPQVRYILSANLVLGAQKGDLILQPAPLDNGRPTPDAIATLDRWISPQPDSEENIDAFVARVDNHDLVSPEIEGIGRLKGIANPQFNMRVMKVGRTTGLTSGEITLLSASIMVHYDDSVFTFNDVIGTNVLSAGGDSGAILVTEDRRAVGMLFASAETAKLSFYFPIQRVLDALTVSLVTD